MTLGIALAIGLAVTVNPLKLLQALAKADPGPLLLMVPCVLLVYVVQGTGWWMALRGAGVKIQFARAIEITFMSQAFVFVPGGDLWRVALVRRYPDIGTEPGDVAAAVVFCDLIYFMVLTMAIVPAAITEAFAIGLLLIVLLPQIAILTVLLQPRLYAWLLGHLGHLNFLRSLELQLERLGPAFRRLCTPRILIPILAVDLLNGLLAILLFGLGLSAVHAAAPAYRVALTYATGQVLSGLTLSAGTLGLYEAVMTGMLALQGVAPASAAAAAFLYRFFNDVLMAVVGLAVAMLIEKKPVGSLVNVEASPGSQAASHL